MAKDMQQVLDYTTGEYVCYVPGDVLKKAVYEKIQALQNQTTEYVKTLNNNIEDKESAVNLLILSFNQESVNPQAEYKLSIAQRISDSADEIKYLNQFFKTVNDSFLYKFNVEQLERFGL